MTEDEQKKWLEAKSQESGWVKKYIMGNWEVPEYIAQVHGAQENTTQVLCTAKPGTRFWAGDIVYFLAHHGSTHHHPFLKPYTIIAHSMTYDEGMVALHITPRLDGIIANGALVMTDGMCQREDCK